MEHGVGMEVVTSAILPNNEFDVNCKLLLYGVAVYLVVVVIDCHIGRKASNDKRGFCPVRVTSLNDHFVRRPCSMA